MAPLLLSTKYAPPPLPPHGVIERAVLSESLSASGGVILVSAPPGYGKTTFVLDWLARSGQATAWLTLDPADSDPAVFGAYLVAAVRRALPGLDPGVGAGPEGAGPVASLLPLLNALDSLGQPLVIALDDYHEITSAAVHELTAFLARHLPATARLAIITRQDPPLPLARLRARSQLVEVRAADLRFGPGDAGRFLAESMGVVVTASAIERLTDRTEGWIAGLQLAGLSLRTSSDAEAFVAEFGATDRYIFDYLTDEALASQPPAVRSFLEATCVLSRLTGPLCDAVTGGNDGAEMLATLSEANLFLAPLDDRRAWYRYHRLFADLVASGLDPSRRSDLHRRAAGWYASNRLMPEAIHHALAAGDAERAAALMEAEVEGALARGETRTIVGWCDALPAGTLDAHPVLGVMRAWATFFLGDIAGAEALLGRVDPRGPADTRTSARRLGLEAWFANRHDRAEAEALARGAIEGLDPGDPVFRGLAFTTLGESLVGSDVRRAIDAFEEAHRCARQAGRSALLAGTIYSLANTNVVYGRRRAAEELCRRAIDEVGGQPGGAPAWIGMVHLSLGTALFEADELVQARQHIATGQKLCDRAGLRVTMLGASEWYEVLGLHLLGERDAAWRRLEAVRREAERVGITRVATAMTLLAAELLLLEDDAAEARRRLDVVPAVHPTVLGTIRDRGRQTWARVLVATGEPAEALRILEPLAVEQRAGARFGRLVATLVATAIAHDRSSDRAAATAALEEAVTLAADEGYRRAFLDPALPLRGLLQAARRANPAFVDGLAEGRRDRDVGGPAGLNGPASGGGRDGALVEPLSVREIEVLRLVAGGLSNDEIGRALFISTGTAKWHVHNVIAKLGARNRVTLVARARELGLA
jgi:LuxR family maltose regulon positive regulatory protein